MQKISIEEPLYAICMPNKGVVVSEKREFAVSELKEANDYLWDDIEELPVASALHVDDYSESTQKDMVCSNMVIVRVR